MIIDMQEAIKNKTAHPDDTPADVKIAIKDLNLYYGAFHALHGINLDIERGKITAFIGPSGCGKSTLLKTLNRMNDLIPDCRVEGSITLDGEDIYGSMDVNLVFIDGVSASDRRSAMLGDIFMVPEEFTLPQVTLDTYVKMNKVFYPHFSEEVLERCLADFELSRQIKLHQLSMGQKKKAFMSFALATGTRLLLMDEPTNGLDIPSKSQFRKVIANNMTDDRILIISTHQVHDVESLLDHVLILSQSNLLLNASVSDISDDYKFEYRTPAEMDDNVLYAEPSLQGNAVIARRQKTDNETPLNLELLFNAVINGKLG